MNHIKRKRTNKNVFEEKRDTGVREAKSGGKRK